MTRVVVHGKLGQAPRLHLERPCVDRRDHVAGEVNDNDKEEAL